MMKPLEAQQAGSHNGGASFSLADRLRRVAWMMAWGLLASWTPPPMNKWRCFLLRLFGAKIGRGARVYGSVKVWYPANLEMGDHACLGRNVTCYNQGHIFIGSRAADFTGRPSLRQQP
jgi:putative colanic acid biosynthesis acetyltransferase WcaF